MLAGRTSWALVLLALVGATQAAELTSKETKEAHKLYVAKCAKCHEFYPPANYSEADWDGWMIRMGKKSKLQPRQLELLQRYTAALRAVPKPEEKK